MAHRLLLLFVVAWMGVLFWLSNQPGIEAPMLFSGQDKVFHAGVYGILGAFVLGSMSRPVAGYTGRQMLISVAIASLYGISDEFHQSFVPGRSPDVWDWVADTTGALLAVVLLARLTRTFSRRAA